MPRSQQLTDLAVDWLQTNVLRLIATKVLPLLAGFGALNAVLAWLQDEVGLNLPPEVVVAWLGTVMAGAVAAAFAYVRNHGGAAVLGRVLLELEQLGDAGEAARELSAAEGRQLGLGDEAGYGLVEVGLFVFLIALAVVILAAVL